MFSIGPVIVLKSFVHRNQELLTLNYKSQKEQDLRGSLSAHLISRLIFTGRYLDICFLSCLFFLFQLRGGYFWNDFTLPKNVWEMALNSSRLCKNPSDAPKEKSFLCFVPVHAALMTGFQWKKLVLLCAMQMRHHQQHLQSRKEKRCEWAKPNFIVR